MAYGYNPLQYKTDYSGLQQAGQQFGAAAAQIPEIAQIKANQRNNLKDYQEHVVPRLDKIPDSVYQELGIPKQQFISLLKPQDSVMSGKTETNVEYMTRIAQALDPISKKMQEKNLVGKVGSLLDAKQAAAQPLTTEESVSMPEGQESPRLGMQPGIPQTGAVDAVPAQEGPQPLGLMPPDVQGPQPQGAITPTVQQTIEPARQLEPEQEAIKSAEYAMELKKQMDAGMDAKEAQSKMFDFEQGLKADKTKKDEAELSTMMKEFYDADVNSKDFAAKNVVTNLDKKILSIDEKIKDIRSVGKMVTRGKPEAAVEAAKRGLPADTYAVNKALTKLEYDKKSWEKRKKDVEAELTKLAEQREIDQDKKKAEADYIRGGKAGKKPADYVVNLQKVGMQQLSNAFPDDVMEVGKDVFGSPIYKTKPNTAAAKIAGDPALWTEFLKSYPSTLALYEAAGLNEDVPAVEDASSLTTPIQDISAGTPDMPKASYKTTAEAEQAATSGLIKDGDWVYILQMGKSVQMGGAESGGDMKVFQPATTPTPKQTALGQAGSSEANPVPVATKEDILALGVGVWYKTPSGVTNRRQ